MIEPRQDEDRPVAWDVQRMTDVRTKRIAIMGVIVTVIVVLAGIAVYLMMSPGTSVSTIPESSHAVLAGNLSYPGFYAWQMPLRKGDRVELAVHASHAVNLLVVPDGAHQAWTGTYYHTADPGLHYPTDQALVTSGQVLSDNIVFTAPNDGTYDLVALNTFPSIATVTMSGAVHHTG